MASPRSRTLAEPLIYLVAAESSGDAMGADLARALRAEAAAPIALAGVGGRQMAREGIESPFDISDLSVLGFFEGLKAWPRVRRRARETAAHAAPMTPAAAVLIDSWGFNLRVAWAMRKVSPDTKLIKYVGPQVFATRPGRARVLANAVDLLMTIHSFDAPYFERYGLKTVFTGNPALHRGTELGDGAAFRARHGLGDAPILLVMFGSRRSELERLYEPFMEAARRLAAERPGLRLVCPAADSIADLVRERAGDAPDLLLIPEAERADAYSAAGAAIACSGTAVSELALSGVPAVVGYRMDPISYAVIKRVLRTPWISLVNIAAGDMLAPELLQDACTPEALAAAAAPLLDDAELAAGTGARLRATAETMKGEADSPARVAARTVLEVAGVAVKPDA